MHVYFVECMFVCVDSLTCCLRGPRGRLAMPNELPSINKDFHFTSLHFIVSNRLSLSYPNLNKNMKTYIRFKQHKNPTPKHKTNGTTTEVSPWNDQQYRSCTQ